MSLSLQIDNKKTYILILGIDSTQGLNDTILTAKAQCSVNFSRWNRIFFMPKL